MEYDNSQNRVYFSEQEVQEFALPNQLAPGTVDFEIHEDRIRAASIDAVIAARLAIEEETTDMEHYSVLQQRAQRTVTLCLALRNIRRRHEIASLEQDFER